MSWDDGMDCSGLGATMPIGVDMFQVQERDELDDLLLDSDNNEDSDNDAAPVAPVMLGGPPPPAGGRPGPRAALQPPKIPSPGMDHIAETTMPLTFDPLETTWGKLGLTKVDWDYLAAIHRKFDTSRNGSLSNHEVQKLCRRLLGKSAEAAEMMRKLDEDGSGGVSLEEFARNFIMLTVRPEERYGITRERYEELVVLFRKYDRDRDGYLSWPEFRTLAEDRQFCHDIDGMDKFFMKMDVDGNGKMCLHEFLLSSRAMKAGRMVVREFGGEDSVSLDDVRQSVAQLLGESSSSGSLTSSSGGSGSEGISPMARSLGSSTVRLGKKRTNIFKDVASHFYGSLSMSGSASLSSSGVGMMFKRGGSAEGTAAASPEKAEKKKRKFGPAKDGSGGAKVSKFASPKGAATRRRGSAALPAPGASPARRRSNAAETLGLAGGGSPKRRASVQHGDLSPPPTSPKARRGSVPQVDAAAPPSAKGRGSVPHTADAASPPSPKKQASRSPRRRGSVPQLDAPSPPTPKRRGSKPNALAPPSTEHAASPPSPKKALKPRATSPKKTKTATKPSPGTSSASPTQGKKATAAKKK